MVGARSRKIFPCRPLTADSAVCGSGAMCWGVRRSVESQRGSAVDVSTPLSAETRLFNAVRPVGGPCRSRLLCSRGERASFFLGWCLPLVMVGERVSVSEKASDTPPAVAGGKIQAANPGGMRNIQRVEVNPHEASASTPRRSCSRQERHSIMHSSSSSAAAVDPCDSCAAHETFFRAFEGSSFVKKAID